MTGTTIKAGFALSGGGARGAAHIGVLKALREWNIHPSAISGTSAGSIVGAFICDGFSPEETAAIMHSFEFKNKISFLNFRKGFFSIEPIEKLLKNNLRSKNFEQLQIPFYATAADLNTGKPIAFSEGPIVPAVIASSSVPLVFPPVFINDIPYVDGGLSANLPVEPLLNKPEKIIGVHVNPVNDYRSDIGFMENLDRTFNLFLRENMKEGIGKCAVFIEPKGLENHRLFDYKHMMEMVELGYRHVKNMDREEVLKKIG
jgi:NTE family protein